MKDLKIKSRLCEMHCENGPIKKLKATIKRALCKMAQENPKSWDKHVDKLMFTLRTKIKSSPFQRLFGHEARHPSKVPKHFKVASPALSSPSSEESPSSPASEVSPSSPASEVSPSDPTSEASHMSDTSTTPAAGNTYIVTPTATHDPAEFPICLKAIDSEIINRHIDEAWAGKKVQVLLSKIGPYKIFYFDIYNISSQKQLECEVMNGYMTSVIRNLNENSPKKALLIDSNEMTGIWKGNAWKLKIDLTTYSCVLGFVNDHNHWTVVVNGTLYFKKTFKIFYD
ncbi:uncharacterized protein LOC130571539 [Triplophysa rosa]|uniref:uncharacterized protein LOC130571539 n=1 Tax=Triplophysa rosa TaxID=992332 RepID=UPI0025462B56|nr:uncharacterized protein LOC130571539 [Triplophysa rosa]